MDAINLSGLILVAALGTIAVSCAVQRAVVSYRAWRQS